MVAVEHRQKPTASEFTATTTTTMSSNNSEQQDDQQHDLDDVIEMTQQQSEQQQLTTTNSVRVFHSEKMSKNELESAALVKKHEEAAAAAITKSAVSQRSVDIKLANDSHADEASKDLTKKVLKLDLSAKDLDEFSLKSPKSPISARLPHQTSLTSSVDVEDRKTLREALYQGIFHRHRRTIFAVGSFLRMLRSRTTNSQYNTIRSTCEGEDTEEVR